MTIIKYILYFMLLAFSDFHLAVLLRVTQSTLRKNGWDKRSADIVLLQENYILKYSCYGD